MFARWWREQQPFVAQFVHDYGSILVHFLTPFSPCAARRAGYCCASNNLLRSLDRVDAELPGAGSGWSSRWRSRSEGVRGKYLQGHIGSVYTAVGGASVAAVVVIVAAAGATEFFYNSEPCVVRCAFSFFVFRSTTPHPSHLRLNHFALICRFRAQNGWMCTKYVRIAYKNIVDERCTSRL